MIEIFHLELARSLRVMWLLEELGAAYTVRNEVLPAVESFTDVYPLGLLPAVRDNGQVLVESMAICELLARRYGGSHLIPEPSSYAYPAYLQWLWFGEATMMPSLSASYVYSGALPGVPRQSVAEARARSDFSKRLGALDKRLEGKLYVAGDSFTLADISVAYPIFRSHTVLGEGNTVGSNAAAYWERMSNRPAFKAALSRKT